MPAIKTGIITGLSTPARVALGVGGLLALGTAVYLLTGKRGVRNRARIRGWVRQAKVGTVHRFQTLGNVRKTARAHA